MRGRGLIAIAAAAWACGALAAGPPSEKQVISKLVLVPPELMANAKGDGVDIHVRLLNRNRDATLESVTYVLKYRRAGKPEKALRAQTVKLSHCLPMAVCNLLTITGAPLAEAERLKLAVEFTGAKFRAPSPPRRPASAPGR